MALENLSEVLNIEHDIKKEEPSPKKEVITIDAKDIKKITTESTKEESDHDFDQSREVLKELLKTGESAVADLEGIARQSEHPRAYEVLGQMIRTTADTTEKLTNIHKKKEDLKNVKEQKNKSTENTVNIDNVFIGTPSELMNSLKQIEDKKKNE